MLRIFPFRVTLFWLLAACGALCQQREQRRAWHPLPDAPTPQAAAKQENSRWSGAGVSRFASVPANTTKVWAARQTETTVPRAILSESYSDTYEERLAPKESDDFFRRHLYAVPSNKKLNDPASSDGSVVSRATDAASRTFLTRDPSGRSKVNTVYLLRVMSSALVHTAYRPYWNRPASAPFSDFGSTIGNDAGMNVLREFGPQLQQLMKSHAPKFVSKIEERVGR